MAKPPEDDRTPQPPDQADSAPESSGDHDPIDLVALYADKDLADHVYQLTTGPSIPLAPADPDDPSLAEIASWVIGSGLREMSSEELFRMAVAIIAELRRRAPDQAEGKEEGNSGE